MDAERAALALCQGRQTRAIRAAMFGSTMFQSAQAVSMALVELVTAREALAAQYATSRGVLIGIRRARGFSQMEGEIVSARDLRFSDAETLERWWQQHRIVDVDEPLNGGESMYFGSDCAALHGAVSSGQTDKVIWLLNHGADVNASYPSTSVPLLIATHNTQQIGIIAALLAAGADVSAVDCRGASALDSLSDTHHRLTSYLPQQHRGALSDGARASALLMAHGCRVRNVAHLVDIASCARLYTAAARTAAFRRRMHALHHYAAAWGTFLASGHMGVLAW